MLRPNRQFLFVCILAPLACAEESSSSDAFRVALLVPGPISDDGWNASAYEGLTRLKDELGAEVSHVQVKSPSEFEGAFRDFASRGFDLVFGHGFEFSESAARVGPEFPATVFAITSGAAVAENVSSIQFVIDEPAYLAGMLAGQISEAGRIGVVGGMEIPPVKSAFEAFERGVMEVRPDGRVVVSWLGSWEDVSAAYQAALALVDQGADVLFHNADAAGLGVFNAAEERGVLAIGCNKDQARVKPSTVVASVVLDVPESFVRIASDVRSGAHRGRTYRYDLKSGVVDLVYNPALSERVSIAARVRIEVAKEARQRSE